MANKKVLLIGGGGTLGTYTAEELLRLGHSVDVICLEELTSSNENLRYFTERVTLESLKERVTKTHYDGIVNFLLYEDEVAYAPVHELLSANTDHLIFLSSYRIYSNTSPVTEDIPTLFDTVDDEEFFKTEKYATSKIKCERYIRSLNGPKNYTIVRPVISFSTKRLDFIVTSGNDIIRSAKEGIVLKQPNEAKNLTAGLDWAGNSGKLIANLLFKKEAMGEAFTVSSAQNLTWGEIAEIYERLTGCIFKWMPANYAKNKYIWYYDRAYDRYIDNSKILKVTGLTKDDFLSIEEGIKIELDKLGFVK